MQQVITSKVGNVPTLLKNRTRITMREMKQFLACILNMDLSKSQPQHHTGPSPTKATPWFGKIYPNHGFSHLLCFFDLVKDEGLPDPGQPHYNPCAGYQSLVDHANRVFRHHYTPHQEINDNDSLVSIKNKTSLMQHLPNKHHQHWRSKLCKLWMLCDSVFNYYLGFFTHRGSRSQEAKDNIKESGLKYTVVKKLLATGVYFNKSYHVFIDN
jgi:hypothetical protein